MGKSTISMGELRLCWKPAFMFVRASTRVAAFSNTSGGWGSVDQMVRWSVPQSPGGPRRADVGGDLGTMLHQTVSKVRKIQNIWKIWSYYLIWITMDCWGFWRVLHSYARICPKFWESSSCGLWWYMWRLLRARRMESQWISCNSSQVEQNDPLRPVWESPKCEAKGLSG